MNSLAIDEIRASLCYQYADDVAAGRVVACVKVKQAAQRFLSELGRMSDPDYPWLFDLDKAYRPIRFIEQFLRPSKGDYDKMELLPWQHFCEGNLYGWVDKETGLRRFRDAVILVASGNGKSTMVVGNAAFAAAKDGERGSEVYMLANSKEQARIVFGECQTQIKNSPLLNKHFRITRDGIYFDATNSRMQPLATDHKNLDGRAPHLAIFDEVQEYTNYRLINIIDKKKIKRRQPMSLYISTLGTVIDGPLMDFYVTGGHILAGDKGIDKRVADRTFVYIAEIDEGDAPENPDCWGKANPSMGTLLHLEDLLDDWEKCKRIPEQRSNFINKSLNVFTSVDELSFLDNETILANNRTIDPESLSGRRCYGGFDLAETEDFTSACLEFPLDDGSFALISHSWVPRKKVRGNKEKLDWQNLVREGHLTIINGAYVDYQAVMDWFLEMRGKYRIETVGFDRAKAFLLVNAMRAKGFVLNEVAQGELTLTNPLDHLKECFLDGRVVHNNNRMYTWYLRNVRMTKRGANGTYLPTKQNRNRKIDGFAAHLNAHTEWQRNHPNVIPPGKRVARTIKLEM